MPERFNYMPPLQRDPSVENAPVINEAGYSLARALLFHTPTVPFSSMRSGFMSDGIYVFNTTFDKIGNTIDSDRKTELTQTIALAHVQLLWYLHLNKLVTFTSDAEIGGTEVLLPPDLIEPYREFLTNQSEEVRSSFFMSLVAGIQIEVGEKMAKNNIVYKNEFYREEACTEIAYAYLKYFDALGTADVL